MRGSCSGSDDKLAAPGSSTHAARHRSMSPQHAPPRPPAQPSAASQLRRPTCWRRLEGSCVSTSFLRRRTMTVDLSSALSSLQGTRGRRQVCRVDTGPPRRMLGSRCMRRALAWARTRHGAPAAARRQSGGPPQLTPGWRRRRTGQSGCPVVWYWIALYWIGGVPGWAGGEAGGAPVCATCPAECAHGCNGCASGQQRSGCTLLRGEPPRPPPCSSAPQRRPS